MSGTRAPSRTTQRTRATTVQSEAMRRSGIERESNDWRSSDMQASPQNRRLMLDEDRSRSENEHAQLPSVKDTSHEASRSGTKSPSKQSKGRMPILKKSSQRIELEEESDIFDGSVDAWKVQQNPKKANSHLRKELAHVSRLRDLFKIHGKDENIWEFERKTFPGMANYIKEIHFGPVNPPVEETEPARLPVESNKDASEAGKSSQGSGLRSVLKSRSRTSRSERTRPATSLQDALQGAPDEAERPALSRTVTSKSARLTAAMSRPATTKSHRSTANTRMAQVAFRAETATPGNPYGPEMIKKLLGTHSRPTTMRKAMLRRQPQAELHLLWAGAPKPEAFKEEKEVADPEVEARRVRDRQNRQLIKTMRKQIQARMTDTENLPKNLWKYFKDADDDGSGRIEYAEYVKVMSQMGLGTQELGETNLATLFRLADKDRNGNIDFNEFLRTVVGNFVSL